jgi:hypothetical protein
MLESLAEDQERERQRREVAHHAQQFTKSLDQWVFVPKFLGSLSYLVVCKDEERCPSSIVDFQTCHRLYGTIKQGRTAQVQCDVREDIGREVRVGIFTVLVSRLHLKSRQGCSH